MPYTSEHQCWICKMVQGCVKCCPRSKEKRRQDGAVLLDMGEFVHQLSPAVPQLSNPREDPSQSNHLGVATVRASGSQRTTNRSRSLERGGDSIVRGHRRTVHLRLYQILAPNMVSRGRVFGSFLSLKPEEWKPTDVSYFETPGQSVMPLWAMKEEM